MPAPTGDCICDGCAKKKILQCAACKKEGCDDDVSPESSCNVEREFKVTGVVSELSEEVYSRVLWALGV